MPSPRPVFHCHTLSSMENRGQEWPGVTDAFPQHCLCHSSSTHFLAHISYQGCRPGTYPSVLYLSGHVSLKCHCTPGCSLTTKSRSSAPSSMPASMTPSFHGPMLRHRHDVYACPTDEKAKREPLRLSADLPTLAAF